MQVNLKEFDIDKAVSDTMVMKEEYNPPTLQYVFEHKWALSIVKHNRDFEFSVFSLSRNPRFRHQSNMKCLNVNATKDEIRQVITEMISDLSENITLLKAM